MERRKNRKLARRREHVRAQNDKRKAALASDGTMEDQGYVKTWRGKWQRKHKPIVKQPRKDR
jgi:hypothetical protein